jgi:hypothetical protein
MKWVNFGPSDFAKAISPFGQRDKMRQATAMTSTVYSLMDDNRDELLAPFETGVWIVLIIASAAILGLIFWLGYSILL